MCDQLVKVHASLLDWIFAEAKDGHEAVFIYWRSIGEDSRPTLRNEAPPYQDQIPFTYRSMTGAEAMVEAWEKVGRICIVAECELLSKAQEKDARKRKVVSLSITTRTIWLEGGALSISVLIVSATNYAMPQGT